MSCLRTLRVVLSNDHGHAAWALLWQAVWVLSEDLRALTTLLWLTTLDTLVGVVLALAALTSWLIHTAGTGEVSLLVQTFTATLGDGPGIHLDSVRLELG